MPRGSGCMRSTSVTKQEVRTAGSEKSRDQFLAVLMRHLKTCHIDTNEKLLVIGGSWQDVELLISAGFKDITLSNFQPELEESALLRLQVKVKLLTIDAEQIDLIASSFTKSCTIAGPRTEPCVKCSALLASMSSCWNRTILSPCEH